MKLHFSTLKASLLPGAGLVLLASAAFVSPMPQDVAPLPDQTLVNVQPYPDVPKVDPVRHWEPYCESLPNSTGVVSTMSVTGNLSISSNNTWIHSFDCPSGEYGVFLFGEQPAALPWGNGVLCISPFFPGVMRLNVPDIIPFGGQSDLFLNLGALPPQMQLVAGKAYYFQCMFRDPSVGERFNLSNAVSVTFGP